MSAFEKNITIFAWVCTLVFLLLSGTLLYLLLRNGLHAFYVLISDHENYGSVPVLFHRIHLLQRLVPAILGTVAVIMLTLILASPLGIAIGVWSSLFATPSLKKLINFVVQLLSSTPSIVLGFAGYFAILFVRQEFALEAKPCLLLAGLCLSLLVLPVLIRTTENSLNQVSEELKLTGLSLGLSPMQNALFVLLPKARRGVGRGIFLATVRAAEDTAVIMLTGAVADAILPNGLIDPFCSLSIQILYGITENRGMHDQLVVFATSLVLVTLTFLLSLIGERFVGGRSYAQ